MGVESFSFRVTGEAITSRARDLLLDDRTVDALKFLGDSLDGISLEQSFSILTGASKLVNGEADGIVLVSDEDSDYRHELDQRFGSRIKFGEKWYEPYALVTDIGQLDYSAGTAHRGTLAGRTAASTGAHFFRHSSRDETAIKFEAARVTHYADAPDSDVVQYVGEESRDAWTEFKLARSPLCVIFRETLQPPSGWVSPRGVAESIAKAVSHGRIEIRGHSHWYPQETAHAAAAPNAVLTPPTEEALEEQRAHAERENARYEAEIAEIARKVRERAGPEDGDGWMDITCGERTIHVPRLPFEAWALRKARPGFKSPWEPVSPPGLKLENDDRFHSDWMLGAGLALESMYYSTFGKVDGELVEAAWDAAAEIQKAHLNLQHVVLSGQGVVMGKAYIARRGREDAPAPRSIVVLPDASAEWLEVIQAAAGAIVERGGEMAHLITVFRPSGLPIVRIKGARAAFQDGDEVTIDCNTGMANIAEHRHRSRQEPEVDSPKP